MIRRRFTLALSVWLLFAANAPAPAQVRKRARVRTSAPILERNIRAELSFLASDAMQGRGSGTNYERVAAEYIGSQFRQFGLEGGGEADASGKKGFVQRVPLAAAKFTEQAETASTWNAVGVLRGSDLNGETIMLSAHLDHLGVNEALNGDKIFNGADDDASGCVAVMEMARVLAAGPRPRRTIYFVCFGSEERGGYGARYFIANSPTPLERIVADFNFEMLGRPDAKVAPGTLWLTGYERSTLGPELVRQGAALVADPHPEQNFFQRSDNYTLALRGVVAHTVSSFGLHTDYHRPSDEISKIDFTFMTQALNSLVRPIQWLSNTRFRPAWLPGQAPMRVTR
ncbi:MAG TPA: M20/M25/M40 family metallo-hydrolase [Pyrinomonadaceae bacterium]|nr:M20/M25/M40 family metallo-hydrolase [Pyrinomonadaceae bacterium]